LQRFRHLYLALTLADLRAKGRWEEDSSAHVFYTETPLAANTTYRVTIDATRGTESLHFEWTFTTGEASRW